jgi:colanic acid/amylovoran biosynthesis glycosyltransferase
VNKSIKVLHVVETYLNRTEVFIYNYLNAFINAKPYVLAGSQNNIQEFPFSCVKYISSQNSKKSLLWWISFGYKLATGRSLRQKRIQRFIEDLKPDLIHAHFGPSGYDMLPYRREFNIPLVTTFYGYDMSRLPREKMWQVRYAKLFSEGDLFLVEGPHMRNKLIEIGAPEDKVQIQRIAIHTEKYPNWKPDKNKATILFVGRFTEKKGLIYALEAINKLKEKVTNIEFRVIGDGSERDKIYKFVTDNNMQNCVTFLGMKAHHEVIKELSEANAFIHPSVTAEDGDSEGGAPTILLEAQAIGVPIVSTYHADIPNIVSGGDGIYLCDERDVTGLVDALLLALKSKLCSQSSFVKEFHDVRKEVSILEEKYFALISNSRRVTKPT